MFLFVSTGHVHVCTPVPYLNLTRSIRSTRLAKKLGVAMMSMSLNGG